MSVLTLGETMALFDPLEHGAPSLGKQYSLRFAGAESNLAIGLARLGVKVRWISRLGLDAVGDIIVDTLRTEGVDVSGVIRDATAGTGAFMKIRTPTGTRVQYFRRGSAASRLTPDDVPDAVIEEAELVHLTGITLALSDSARATVIDVARRAHQRGVTVVFDPNYRPALWRDAEVARDAQLDLLPYVDWYLAGDAEARTLGGETSIPVKHTVIRQGSRGTTVDGVFVPLETRTDAIDEVGAGDAFAAGFIHALLSNAEPREAVRAAQNIASFALRGTGDWETLPKLDQLRQHV